MHATLHLCQIEHLYTLQSNHPDKSRKYLTPYTFTIFINPIHYAALYIWILSFQNVLLYQVSTGDRLSFSTNPQHQGHCIHHKYCAMLDSCIWTWLKKKKPWKQHFYTTNIREDLLEHLIFILKKVLQSGCQIELGGHRTLLVDAHEFFRKLCSI